MFKKPGQLLVNLADPLCFKVALFELRSSAGGEPRNLLCADEASLGDDSAGIQGSRQQIRKKVLPPSAEVNDVSGLFLKF